jgi:hypothetical protein
MNPEYITWPWVVGINVVLWPIYFWLRRTNKRAMMKGKEDK